MHNAKLPYDCWRAIVDYLPRDDLSALSLVSREIRSMVEPLLYRTISWSWDEPIPARRILGLSRKILDRPELAPFIQTICLLSTREVFSSTPWNPPETDMDWDAERAEYSDVVRLAQGHVDDARFPDAEKWNYAIERGDPHAFVSIILSRLHNIRSLRLDYMFVWRSGFPGLMLKHALFSSPEDATSPLSRFQYLEELDYGGNVRIAERVEEYVDLNDLNATAGYPDCEPDQFMAWFYLPSLKSLAIWLRDARDIGTSAIVDRKTNLSQLHTLILTRPTIRELDVLFLLSQAANGALHTLHLGLAYRWGRETALENGREIVQGLDCVAESVMNLSLGLEYYPPAFGLQSIEANEQSLSEKMQGFLLQFRNLRKVEVPVTLLVGWDDTVQLAIGSILPETVEDLCIRVDFQGVENMCWTEQSLPEWIHWHISDLRYGLRNIKQIISRTWAPLKPDWSDDADDERLNLQDLCLQLGIRFDVVEDELGVGLWTRL